MSGASVLGVLGHGCAHILPPIAAPSARIHNRALGFSVRSSRSVASPMANLGGWLSKLGVGRATARVRDPEGAKIAQGPDDDAPAPGQEFAQFGAGCFWGVELAFQRIPGVTKTEVGYSQGTVHNPSYEDVCNGDTGHSEVVRVQYNPKETSFSSLLDVFWDRHDPTTLNRQGNDVGTQYRSGIYFYHPEQEKAARESMQKHEEKIKRKIVTEILPATKFYRAEEYHQQYLAKGGRSGFRQSAEKGCNDPIRCYG
ncbi:peptide methionine sulfoxide reductase A1 [Selaginella moellendorffii]|nr:peptide methionine sulfoxide reductase A1 [Selaginella moellendorffii]XP_024542309.1 peptide methionine sulfoxide reductase A1 [Selaginella moellendorffii]XP_024542315.1 peptide methionine sulfoxide reductase A1 [Selaginella moellendorffii]|eukprot:XP_024542303.1 peptide methionine sulfoxide reductase A1 [Selaginella moellendorffii]